MSEPKIISISAKCSDLFASALLDADGKEIHVYNGYVPDFFPEEHYGDYVILDIDLATGQITNWHAPTAANLKKFMETKS